MVLGLRSKNRKGASVQVDYIIHLQQIKPWPPSQSLRSLRSVLLQWENGEKNSGSTNPVMPLLGSSAAEGKIEFNESFKLQVTFLREGSARGNDVFQKNVLEFNLYEPRRDKTIKGQHLGSAVIDLTEHGIIRDTVKVGVPVNCKRSFRNTVQPLLYLMIQPFENDSLSSSSRESLSKEASMDKDGRESVSALMSEEYAEEAEIASFTDDDVSSHSSLTMSSSAFEANADVPVQSSPGEQVGHENGSKAIDKRAMVTGGKELALEYVPTEKDQKPSVAEYAHNADPIHQNGTSLDNLSTETVHLESDNASSSNFLQSPTPRPENSDKDSSHSSSFTEEATRSNFSKDGMERDDLVEAVQTKNKGFTGEENAVENPVNDETGVAKISNSVEFSDVNLHDGEQNLVVGVEPEDNVADDGKLNLSRDESNEASSSIIVHDISGKGAFEEKLVKYASEEKTEAQNYEIEYERFAEIPPDSVMVVSLADKEHTPDSQQHNSVETGIQKPAADGTMKSNPNIFNGKNSSTMTSYRLKSRNFSVRSQPESHRVTGSAVNDKYMDDAKEIDVQEDVYSGGLHCDVDGDKDERERASGHLDRVKNACRYNRNGVSSNKLQELEHKVEMLESELMEAAAIEISLYSVVAEHLSSAHKVHTPARRLSRLYIHASRQWSRERMANAAKNIISGLVLAAKSCGNDVPRLTFWLSNSVVLRTIVMQEFGHQELPLSTGLSPVPNGGGIVPREKSCPLRWESTARKKEKASCTEASDDWEDPCTFITALERIEAWIFSRIIESIWWQTLTPHMQCPNEDGEKERVSNPKRVYKKQSSLGDQQQANKAIEIWKNAFADACERLCPVRAAGHECGCLPVLARLVMEQCVARLDVAMFNAILRESDDEIPTDPVADPISDSKVLPIPSGKLSFGAGAQLKNAIGNWSRWLTDLFGMDMDDSPQEEIEEDDRFDVAASLKSFHLLNALSDLLMLPKDMLLEASIRKEVCPTFSASMIRRILGSFSPDEFCPDAIPDAVFESLDSEDPPDTSDEGAKSSPCDASPIRYSPPSVALVQSIIGDVRLSRSGSSVVRKCHTSDDELEELESPLKSIITDKSSPSITKSKGRTAPNAVRYQLLREVWRDYN